MQRFTKTTVFFLLLAFGVSPISVHADSASKSAKLNELMELSGLVELMEQTRRKNKAQALNYKQKFMNQIRAGLEVNDPEVWEYFEVEYQKLIDSLEPQWTAKEAVKKYTDLYGQRMTEEEIDKVLEFSKSTIGRKSTAVSKEVVPIWIDFLTKGSEQQLSDSLQKFVASLKSYIKEKKRAQNNNQ